MSTEPPATGGRRRHAARNAAIADAVMHGASLREVGKAHGLIFSRVHKIVADECRRRNPALYARLQKSDSPVGLKTLVEHAANFGWPDVSPTRPLWHTGRPPSNNATRDWTLTSQALHGDASLRQLAQAQGLSTERVRQIVADECRRRNPALYDALTQAGRADLETLREHAAAFGVTTPAPRPVNEFGHIRRQLGLSQRQYAKALGLSTLTIWHYERGSRRIPHPVMVAARSLHAPTQTSPPAG